MSSPAPLTVLYRDDNYVAIDKPPGLIVHRSPLVPPDTPAALQRLRDQLGQHIFPIHRLDRPTSGVLVFGLNAEAAGALAGQFAARTPTKRYLAIVRGWPLEHIVLDHPLRALDSPPHKNLPLEAITEFTRIAQTSLPVPVDSYPERRYALVLAQPRTGRRHQIRRHLKHLSHPIVGDVRHGKGTHNRFFREHFAVHRLLLAAISLAFDHPITGERVTINAPPGEAFTRICDAFAWTEVLVQTLMETDVPALPA